MYYRPVTSDKKDREYDNASPTVTYSRNSLLDSITVPYLRDRRNTS